MSNLDPAFTIGSQLIEPMRVYLGIGKAEAKQTRARPARPGRHPEPEAHLRRLPAPGLRRHGPARADRRRRLVRPRPAHRRRAHHRPGRHRPGRGARPAARPAGGAPHGRAARHPQLRRRRRPLRPGLGHAQRPDRRDRARRGPSSPARSTSTPRRCSTRSSRTAEPRAPADAPPTPLPARTRRTPDPERSRRADDRATRATACSTSTTSSSSTPAKGFRGQAVPGAARASRSTSCPARPSAWSASPGPARPPSAAPCSASPRSPGARSRFDGRDIGHLPARERRALSSDIQVVFQDPYTSLNPSLTIEQILTEPLTVAKVPRAEAIAAGPGAARPGPAARQRRRPAAPRVHRRPAAAHRDRPGARASTRS